jgi:N-acetylglucosaminyl-diphospho-decaprenol L-rhamnosyltransferase
LIDLSILIVSWNVRDLLAACLDSIAAAPVIIDSEPVGADLRTRPTSAGEVRVEVIVVESASSDGSADMIRSQYPWVCLLAQDENVGFTRGTNLALETAQGRHVLLLNPDTVIRGDALNQLVDALDAQPTVGIVGPRVLNDDGTTQSTRRRFPTRLTAIFESTWLQAYAPHRMLDRFYVTDLPDDGTFEVDWVQGCALAARRAVYEQIGLLDPGYVMFSEELDWCRRAKDAGWRVLYLGSAQVTHYGGKSTEQVQANKHIYFQQSKLRYFRKFHGRGFALALRVFLLLSYSAQIGVEGCKALVGHKRPVRRERIQTYWRVIRALALHTFVRL